MTIKKKSNKPVSVVEHLLGCLPVMYIPVDDQYSENKKQTNMAIQYLSFVRDANFLFFRPKYHLKIHRLIH